MSVHQFDPNMLPDDEFLPGSLKYLVPGNLCRLLDGRRTPGEIVQIDLRRAMFTWRIGKFEDEGKEWRLPVEEVERYQFDKSARTMGAEEVDKLRAAVSRFQKPLILQANEPARRRAEKEIDQVEGSIQRWLTQRSDFIKRGAALDLESIDGPEELAEDLIRYMDHAGLLEQEVRTSKNMVLNPNSGEWIKGMEIVLAEMGLISYTGKIPRTEDIFKGPGARQIRRSYLIHRLGFVRAYFHLLGFQEVVLFRGMSTESDWQPKPRSLLSTTFSLTVAKSFAKFKRDDKFLGAYLLKFSAPVERLFMTFLETREMNQQYREAEAVVLFDPQWTWIP